MSENPLKQKDSENQNANAGADNINAAIEDIQPELDLKNGKIISEEKKSLREGSQKSLRKQKSQLKEQMSQGGKPAYHPIVIQANYLANKPKFYTPLPKNPEDQQVFDGGDIVRKRYIICQSTQIFLYLLIQFILCIYTIVQSSKAKDSLNTIQAQEEASQPDEITEDDTNNINYLKSILSATYVFCIYSLIHLLFQAGSSISLQFTKLYHDKFRYFLPIVISQEIALFFWKLFTFVYLVQQYKMEGYYKDILDADQDQLNYWNLCYLIFWSSILFFFMLIVLPFGQFPKCIYTIPEKKSDD